MTTDFTTPRIKIVQGWPMMKSLKQGDIISYSELTTAYRHFSEAGDVIYLGSELIDQYPIHFKHLIWNDERTEEQLAEVKYVKVLKDDHRQDIVPYYGPIDEWLNGSVKVVLPDGYMCAFISYKNCIPCTEQEYLNALK